MYRCLGATSIFLYDVFTILHQVNKLLLRNYRSSPTVFQNILYSFFRIFR